MPRSPSKPSSNAGGRPKTGGRFSDQRPRQERRFAEGAGRRGEFWAELFLRAQFYRVLARRVKTPVGEIDLIMRRGNLTVFVEVKARAFSHQELDALMAVNRRRIVSAAQMWLMRRPELAAGDLRFDVIFLAPFAWPRHIVNAFQ
jgi:putative endonuclease